MLKNDRWIREMAEKGMIEPFVAVQVKAGVISYGLSSYGYDIRVADEFKVFTNTQTTGTPKERGQAGVNAIVVDPKRFDPECLVDVRGDHCLIPPNSFALARSVEYFRIPRNVMALCTGKSTYARCGIVCNVTPLEAGWEGHVTIEISNTTPLSAKIYANEGLCQVLFFESDEECEISYADRQGRYMRQRGITLPKVDVQGGEHAHT